MFRPTLPAAALILAACGGVAPDPAPIAPTGAWRLVALSGAPVSPGITLTLAADGSASGDAPCNRYFGTYEAGDDFSFSLPQIGATRRACPELQLEAAYLDALGSASQYRLGREGNTFALLDAAGRTVAAYERAG